MPERTKQVLLTETTKIKYLKHMIQNLKLDLLIERLYIRRKLEFIEQLECKITFIWLLII